ncbi:MAG: hypothetical protein RJR34_13180, partial [Candidatus Methanoculleus thermohydrogenotrophicum]|nr:hypothetical protein [Candidatus Methanoculleus thermohydrogenotrophicum]
VIVPEQREEVGPPEHGQRLPPALLQDEEGGETLRLGVSGALLPPLRQGDPFLRFALDAEGEDGSGRRREVEVATDCPIAVDKMSPGSIPRRSTRSCRTACCSRLPLALREAGVEATTQTTPCSLMSL